MVANPEIQAIASESAKAIVQEFLQTLPDELIDTLPRGFLEDLTTDLQADLRACIHSRLQWIAQSARAEILEQQRQEHYEKVSAQQNLVNLQLLQKLSESKAKKSQRSPSITKQPRPAAEKPLVEDIPIDVDTPTTAESDPIDYWTQLLANKEANRNRKRRRRSAS
jgi:plasmid maintenance system killer protein